METAVIINKDGFQIAKQSKNQYSVYFSLENNKIRIPEIINFDFIKVIYDLSPDLFEFTSLEKINDTEAILVLLVKPLFEDLGVSQKYLKLHMTCTRSKSSIVFVSKTIMNQTTINQSTADIPEDADLVNVVNMTNEFVIRTPHKIDVLNTILLDDEITIPPFVDKIIGSLLSKLFIRVKQFIDYAVL